MSLAERISRGVKATFAANLLDMLANAALIVVLTRVLLTPEGYGRLNFALSILGVVTIFATLGVPKSAARYVTEYLERDPSQVRHVLGRSTLYIAALTAVVAVAVVLLGRPLARLLDEPTLVPFLAVGGLYVVGRSFSSFLHSVFQGFNRVDWSAAVSVVSGVSRLAFAVGFVLLGFGAVGALLGYVAGFAAAALVGGVVLYRRFYATLAPTENPERGLGRRILEYSVPLTATRGANVLDKKIDTVLVGVLLNMTAVGYYTIAKQVSDFTAMPAASFGFTISPAVGEQHNSDRDDRAARLYERSLELVLLAYVPATAGLVLVADPTIRYIFGTAYLGAVPVVQVFSGFILVNAINKITSDALDYLGRARSRALIKTAMASSNFALNLLLIPTLGVVGAAIATVVTYTVYTTTNVAIIHGELGLRVGRLARHLGVVVLITVGMVAAVLVAVPYVSNVLTLFGAVFLGGAVWAVLAVVSGTIDPREVTEFLA